jgi:DNA repair photolyase
MIVSASYRTDIPAFYGEWFMRRLAAGFATVPSPYGGKPYRVSLTPENVDGFVLWTRNIAPLRDRLGEIGGVAPFTVQFTITGYPRALEAGVIDAEAAVAQIRQVASAFGPRSVVWRYDPIVETSLTSAAWHRDNFRRLAEILRSDVDEVTVSFAHIYAKTRRNMEAAARRHGFGWRDPEDGEKRALAADLAEIAAGQNMRLTICSQPAYAVEGAEPARCIDAERLSDIAGRPIRARTKGNRAGCLCHESRDIGAYDSCPQGCVYCYAVSDRGKAKRFLAGHDAESDSLT